MKKIFIWTILIFSCFITSLAFSNEIEFEYSGLQSSGLQSVKPEELDTNFGQNRIFYSYSKTPISIQQQQNAIRSLTITSNEERRQGTGFFISPTTLVTAHHFIEGLENGLSEMWILGAIGHFRFKKIIAFSKEHDIALIEVERIDKGEVEIPFLKLSSKPAQKGDIIYTLGYAGGSFTSLKSEIKSTTYREGHFEVNRIPSRFSLVELIQVAKSKGVDMSIEKLKKNPKFNGFRKETKGMSGGPAMNDRGEVIGVYLGISVAKLGYELYLGDIVSKISHINQLKPKDSCWNSFKRLLF